MAREGGRRPHGCYRPRLPPVFLEVLGHTLPVTRPTLGIRIAVGVHGEERELLFRVQNDGVGLPETTAGGGIGLRMLASRAQMTDAALSVTPAAGRGTRDTRQRTDDRQGETAERRADGT
jgi:hypothetical protein